MAGAAALIASAAAGPAWAGKTAAPALQVSYPDDAAMSCDQLTAEIARMDQIMGVSNNAAAGAAGQARAAEIGASAAINGALYTGALGRVPGVGLFANGAAMAARRNAADKARKAQEQIRTAEQRRALLNGIYQGRNCGAAPAAAPAPAPAAVEDPAQTAPPAQTSPAPATPSE
jgi:hypothetical protein